MEEEAGDLKECPTPSKGYRPFLLVVLFISLFLSYLIIEPFFQTLVFAIVLSSLFYPVQLFLVKHFRGKRNLAALVIVFIITFLIAIPVFFFTSALVAQGLDSINKINVWVKSGNLQNLAQDPNVISYMDWLQKRFSFVQPEKIDVSTHILELSKNLGQFLLGKGATILGNVASLVSHFFIMIFIVFYLVRDGYEMLTSARYYSPLRKDQEDRILSGVRVVARSVLLGTFLTALSQGLVGGIGLALVGIPAIFWGTVMGFASLIPLIGTALVWIPAAAYLALFASWKSALFLAIWCIVLVGAIDNFLRPFLMKGKSVMSPFYIFLAIIGGVQHFGLSGILYGPLILSFAMIMLYIYGVEYQKDLGLGHKEIP